MRLVNVVVFAALAVPFTVPQAGPSRDVAIVRTQLLAIEADIAHANRDCDYKYFDRVEAEEFIFTDATGKVSTKKEDLAGEKDCRKNENTQSLDEVIVQAHGDVALVSARSTMTATGRGGQTATRRSRFTDVFVWRDGRWQLVAGHSSRIP